MIARRLALAVGAALALTPPTAASVSSSSHLEELVVRMATTPEQHRAVAAYYREKAAEARHEAERHRATGKAYSERKAQNRMALRAHCDRLASSQESVATEYEGLAKLHDAEAAGQR